MSTRLADAVEPKNFLKYSKDMRNERNVLVNSGIYASLPEDVQTALSNKGGRTIDMPFWNELDRSEPDIMTDDPAEKSSPGKITAGSDQAVKQYLHKSWSYMQLASILTGEDISKRIAEFAMSYWEWEEMARIVASMTGVMNANIADNGGDMVFRSYSDLASPTAANRISGSVITRGRLTMGDAMNNLAAIGMHSKIYGDLLDQEKIEFIKPSNAPKEIPTYQGLQVLYDDSFPVIPGANSPRYVSMLFGKGLIAYGEGDIRGRKVSVEEKEDSGNGGGEEILHNRKGVLMHPRGIKFKGANMAKGSPSFAELRDAANWERVHQRKNIRVAFLETN